MKCPKKYCPGDVLVTYENVTIVQSIYEVDDGQYLTDDIYDIDWSHADCMGLHCSNDHLLTIDEVENATA